MKRELNDRFLRSLKPQEGQRIEVSDTKCIGLRFRLSQSGRASWVYEKRIKGGPKRKFTLGTWPKPVSLAQARSMSFEIQAEAQRGIDRVENAKREDERQKIEKATQVSCREVLEAYRELHLSNIATGDERFRQISNALEGLLDVPISQIGRKDLQAAVDTKAQSGRRPYANRIRAALVAFANWAFLRGYTDVPIGAGVAKATKEKARERVPSIEEVRSIWSATGRMGEVWGPFFRLIILTGQRRGEIAKLRWSEVHFENRMIVKPGSETKNGRAHQTHMSEPVYAELQNLGDRASIGEFVFTFDGVRPVANPSHAKGRLDTILGEKFEPWRIHDLRTAMATSLAEAGQPETVVDRILNHSASGSAPSAVARVYNQSEQLPQRANALNKWAEMVTREIVKTARIGR
ncbi:tyrosine-type recombinase/integrase [Sedimentitalea todarodis]|uniref:Tyrosine-type recombinase/integrase n=1 Tax=Sedimentitalea todarodis TaxID=1631240 RepID=A0ABU3VCZ6_9RHOB|nr:tyrosine-type recombinase/integrase [Sedimentitalea todarodis]MDU9004054.1 tyrosine-type recombinase/integrase [Sedimentitalea todarodis]